MRAEEIVAELWRQIRESYDTGKRPERVVLSPENYRLVRDWHAALGELPDPGRDYISKDTIFNLPVFIDSGAGVRVE
jgi:hypothetical protein